jgi:hypothetical protein
MNSPSPTDPQVDFHAKQLLHESGYSVDGLPPPKPRGLFAHALVFFRPFVAFTVAGAIGLIANLIVFFALALMLASQPAKWVHWYFGDNGWRFLIVTTVIAFAIFPKVRRLKLA